MKKSTALILTLCLCTAVLLGGCNKNNDPLPDETTLPAVTEAEPAPYPLILNNVEIPAKPEKIVCLSPALAEIIYELGYSETIIGRSSYCDFPSAITSAEDVGSTANPDLNAIFRLKPDLVLSSTPIASKDIFTLDQEGIKTLIIPAPTTLEGFSSIYTSLGLVFEGIFTGTEKGEETYSSISKLLGNTENLNIGSFVYITEDFSAAGGNTFESAILSCFGTNIAKDSEGYSYDTSLLSENQPDVVIVNNKYTKEAVSENEILGQLEAVKENRIIFVDNLFFERPTGRIKELVNSLIADYSKLGREDIGDTTAADIGGTTA